MLVYVIANNGQPLMPTRRFGKVRRLLKEGKAKVKSRCPFTIQLLYDSEHNIQPISLGIDAGSKKSDFLQRQKIGSCMLLRQNCEMIL